MSLRDEARRLAEEAARKVGAIYEIHPIESALLAFAKLVLEREPTLEMMEAGGPPFKLINDWCAEMQLTRGRIADWPANDPPLKQAYRAMTAELLKELTE